MLVVIAYDVANQRRRIRLHTLLLGFCDPVQESVFECTLNPRQLETLKRRIGRNIRSQDDNVRLYLLCERCAVAVDVLAGPRRPETDGPKVV